MKRFKVYGMGAALVDTEMRVDDAELGRSASRRAS
jgi:hypothetical protein